jgi:hypothetical protein
MLDRERVEAILNRRFPTATPGQIAAATNALMALDAEPPPVRFRPTEPLAGFLSQRSANADDDPLLRNAADRNAGTRR